MTEDAANSSGTPAERAGEEPAPQSPDQEPLAVTNHTSASEIRAEARSKQDAVTWLVGTLGGAGITLAIGLHFSQPADFGSLGWLAVVVTITAYALVAAGIWAAFRVQTTAQPRDLAAHADALVGEGLLVDGLAHEGIDEVDLDSGGHLMVQALTGHPDRDHARGALEKVDRVADEAGRVATANPDQTFHSSLQTLTAGLVAAADQARAWLFAKEVERRYRVARNLMLLAVIMSGVVLTASLWRSAYAPRTQIDEPVAGVLVLDKGDAQELQDQYAQGDAAAPTCRTPEAGDSVPATAESGDVAGPVTQVEVQGCPLARIVADNAITVSSAPAERDTPLPVTAWLGPAHRDEVSSARRGQGVKLLPCHPTKGFGVFAWLLSGSIENPGAIEVDAYNEAPNGSCEPVVLSEPDPKTVVAPRTGAP